jgi:hypothetical protein
MPDVLISFLLTSALLCWYWQYTRRAAPVVRICGRCSDMVRLAPGWPTKCPSCGAFLIG